MKQRLGIAIALLGNPKLLILDEPTNGLDPKGMHEIRQLIESLKNEGKTIFISSHILGEIEMIATHYAIIQNGKLIFNGDTEELRNLSDYNLINFYKPYINYLINEISSINTEFFKIEIKLLFESLEGGLLNLYYMKIWEEEDYF